MANGKISILTYIFAIAAEMEGLASAQNIRFSGVEVAGRQKNRCKNWNFILGLGLAQHQG